MHNTLWANICLLIVKWHLELVYILLPWKDSFCGGRLIVMDFHKPTGILSWLFVRKKLKHIPSSKRATHPSHSPPHDRFQTYHYIHQWKKLCVTVNRKVTLHRLGWQLSARPNLPTFRSSCRIFLWLFVSKEEVLLRVSRLFWRSQWAKILSFSMDQELNKDFCRHQGCTHPIGRQIDSHTTLFL